MIKITLLSFLFFTVRDLANFLLPPLQRISLMIIPSVIDIRRRKNFFWFGHISSKEHSESKVFTNHCCVCAEYCGSPRGVLLSSFLRTAGCSLYPELMKYVMLMKHKYYLVDYTSSRSRLLEYNLAVELELQRRAFWLRTASKRSLGAFFVPVDFSSYAFWWFGYTEHHHQLWSVRYEIQGGSRSRGWQTLQFLSSYSGAMHAVWNGPGLREE